MFGSVGFAALASALLTAKYKTYGPSQEEKDDAARDRSYRLKFHQSQNRCDQISLASMLTAGVAAKPLSLPILPSLATGLAAGCLLHTVTLSTMEKNESWAEKKQAWKNSYQKLKVEADVKE